jgi:hypothetical protein
MKNISFFCPIFLGHPKAKASASKASGCFMGGTHAVRAEPGKQKTRSCRTQELACSSAQEEMSGEKKGDLLNGEHRRDVSRGTWAAKAGQKGSAVRPRSQQARRWCSIRVARAIPDGCGKSARLIVGKTAATTDGTYGRLKCKTFANPERPCTTRWPCPTCRVHCQHECDVVLNRRARV